MLLDELENISSETKLLDAQIHLWLSLLELRLVSILGNTYIDLGEGFYYIDGKLKVRTHIDCTDFLSDNMDALERFIYSLKPHYYYIFKSPSLLSVLVSKNLSSKTQLERILKEVTV